MPPFLGPIPFFTETNNISTAAGPSHNENLSATASTSNTAGDQQNNARTSRNIAADHLTSNPNRQRSTTRPVQAMNEKELRTLLRLRLKPLVDLLRLHWPLSGLSPINNFDGTSERPLHLPLPVNNCISANLPLPPNWNENMEKVNQTLDPYRLFPVDSKSQEFQILEKLLDPLKICYIDQIVNPTVWTRFVNGRNEMLKANCNDPMVLKELSLSDEEIARKQQSLNFFRHNAVDAAPFDDNFALLFHCTKHLANVEQIQSDGFDERLSKGGTLGRGIYFTDNTRKAIAYDRDNNGVVFICGVLLGDCHTHRASLSRGVSGLVKEPEKLPAERRHIDDNNFDSVMGQFKFNEYAVYNRYQCYPMYKVIYSRMQSNLGAHSSDDVTPPPFGWVAQNEFQKLSDNSTWAFHAKTVFDEMKGVEVPTVMNRSTAPILASIDKNLTQQSIDTKSIQPTLDEIQKYFDLCDDGEVKEKYFQIGMTIDAAFQRNSGEIKKLQKESAAASDSKFMESLLDGTFNDNKPKKLTMTSSSTEPKENLLPPLDPTDPDAECCLICFNSYSKMSNNWKVFRHSGLKICVDCYRKL